MQNALVVDQPDILKKKDIVVEDVDSTLFGNDVFKKIKEKYMRDSQQYDTDMISSHGSFLNKYKNES